MPDLTNDSTLRSLISPENLDTLWSVWLEHAPQEAQVGVDAAKEREEQWACYPWPPVLEVVSGGMVTQPEYGTHGQVVEREELCLVWAGCPELQVSYHEKIETEFAQFLAANVQPPEPYENWTDVACDIKGGEAAFHSVQGIFGRLEPEVDVHANIYQPPTDTQNQFGGLGRLIEPVAAQTDATYDNYVANLEEQQNIPEAAWRRLQAGIRPAVNVGDQPGIVENIMSVEEFLEFMGNGGGNAAAVLGNLIDAQIAAVVPTGPTEATEVGLPEAPDQHHSLAELEDMWVTGGTAELLGQARRTAEANARRAAQLHRAVAEIQHEHDEAMDLVMDELDNLEPIEPGSNIRWDLQPDMEEQVARNLRVAVDENYMDLVVGEALTDTDTVPPL